MDEKTMRVREAERKFLRWTWWGFPAAGLVVAMLTGGGFWAWVDGAVPGLNWRQALTVRGAVLAGAALAAVGAWRVLLKRTWQGWVVALVMAAGFAGAESVVRIPAVQTAFWLATRARLDVDGPNFMSEVCYIRLEEATGRVAEAGAVVLSGTSQMLCGVDELELGKILAPTAVIRREVSGMGPQNMLAAWEWIPFLRGDRSVQVRSEMDFTDQVEWRTSWYRPFLTWGTFPWLMRNAGARTCWRHWDEIPDCAMAATLEGWRMRDGWREIILNPWGRMKEGDETAKPSKPTAPVQLPPLVWSDWEWRAFVDEAERLKAAGVELWVFEGNVHPVLRDERRAEIRVEFERRMEEGVAKGLWRFVGEEELDAGIDAGDWRDMTHVNAEGREKLTRAMGRVLGGRREL